MTVDIMIIKISNIINEWDPIQLFPMAPKDEYIREIEEIYKIINETPDISENILATEIHQLFIKQFGEEVYSSENEECLKVATKILKKGNSSPLKWLFYRKRWSNN